MPRGDAQETGYAADVGGPDASVEEVWTVELSGGGLPYPVVRDGTLYVNDRGEVRAVDAETGAEQWRRSVSSSGGSALAIGDDALYVGGNELVAVDPANGDELWRSDVGGTEPLLQGERLYVTAGGLRCLDAEAGELLWEAAYTGTPIQHAVAPDGPAFVYDQGNVVWAIGEGGSRRWSYDLDIRRLRNGLAVGNGSLFVTNGHTTTTTAFDPRTGEQQWSADVPCNDAPAFDGSFLYVADLLGGVRKIDPETGAVADGWENVDVGSTLGDPIVTEERLYVLGYESTEDDAPYEIVALDSGDGSERWRTGIGPDNPGAFGPTPLSVVDGFLYSSIEGEVRAFAPA